MKKLFVTLMTICMALMLCQPIFAEEELKLSPPWITYYSDLEAMFGQDPEVHLDYDTENYTVTLRVDNQEKAEALMQILPNEKIFGNITLKIRVVPANLAEEPLSALYEKAFKGNPVMNDIVVMDGTGTLFDLTYVVFKKEVVQYFNDNMSDLNGMRTTLYQDIANEVFEGNHDGIYFCTDVN